MPTMNEATTVFERGWIFRYRASRQQPPKNAAVFIHGWTGDENSMEMFARGMPENCLQLFPRGPIPAPGGGYGWTAVRGISNIQMADYAPTAHSLLKEIDNHLSEWNLGGGSFRLVGFSQGAALSYVLTLLYPHRVERMAALAGFLPALLDDFNISALKDKPIYIAHGTRDEIVPVEEARNAVAILQPSGAAIDYCENSAGHKLPTNCFSKLYEFLLA